MSLKNKNIDNTNKADQLIVAESVQTVDDGVNVCSGSYLHIVTDS